MKPKNIHSPFQLKDHYVDELIVKNKSIVLSRDDQHNLRDISIIGAEVKDDLDNFTGSLSLSINVSCKRKDDSKSTISVKIVLTGIFLAGKSEEMDLKKFQDMLILNGATSLYSIARAIIATTTAQCLSSGKVLLPMVNIFEMLNQINTSFDEEGK